MWAYGVVIAAVVSLIIGIYTFGRKDGKDKRDQQYTEKAVEDLKNDQKIDAELRVLSLDLARKRMRDKIKQSS